MPSNLRRRDRRRHWITKPYSHIVHIRPKPLAFKRITLAPVLTTSQEDLNPFFHLNLGAFAGLLVASPRDYSRLSMTLGHSVRAIRTDYPPTPIPVMQISILPGVRHPKTTLFKAARDLYDFFVPELAGMGPDPPSRSVDEAILATRDMLAGAKSSKNPNMNVTPHSLMRDYHDFCEITTRILCAQPSLSCLFLQHIFDAVVADMDKPVVPHNMPN